MPARCQRAPPLRPSFPTSPRSRSRLLRRCPAAAAAPPHGHHSHRRPSPATQPHPSPRPETWRRRPAPATQRCAGPAAPAARPGWFARWFGLNRRQPPALLSRPPPRQRRRPLPPRRHSPNSTEACAILNTPAELRSRHPAPAACRWASTSPSSMRAWMPRRCFPPCGAVLGASPVQPAGCHVGRGAAQPRDAVLDAPPASPTPRDPGTSGTPGGITRDRRHRRVGDPARHRSPGRTGLPPPPLTVRWRDQAFRHRRPLLVQCCRSAQRA